MLLFLLRMLVPGVRLSSEIIFIRPDDSFTAERKTCHLLGRRQSELRVRVNEMLQRKELLEYLDQDLR